MTNPVVSATLNIAGKRKADLAQKRAENLRANLMRRKIQTKERDATSTKTETETKIEGAA